MAVEWFYTTSRQQMGPVSWQDLRELADNGILKPHDLVWTEGMDEWVKAVKQRGLFADGGDSGRVSATRPGRRRKDDEEVEEQDEDDDRTSRKKARRRAVKRTKMATGLKVGLILGGVLCGLLLLGCAGGLMFWLAFRDDPGGPGNHTFTVFNLQQNRFEDRAFTFQQGRRIVITVTNNTQFPNTDVDLLVLRGRGENFNLQDIVALDERVPMLDRNCRVEFVSPATESYRVRVTNLGPGKANSCVVNITIQ